MLQFFILKKLTAESKEKAFNKNDVAYSGCLSFTETKGFI